MEGILGVLMAPDPSLGEFRSSWVVTSRVTPTKGMITHPPSFPQEARTRLLSPVAALPTIPGSSLVEALAPQNSRSGSFLSPVPSQYTGGQDPRDYDSQTPERMLDTCPSKDARLVGGAPARRELYSCQGLHEPAGPLGPKTPAWCARASWGRISPRPAWTSSGTWGRWTSAR